MTRSRRRPHAEMNVVPYIDVMLVLLIIFMITTPLLTQGVDIDLPKAVSRTIESTHQEPVIVSVDADGQYYLNRGSHPTEPLSADELAQNMASLVRTSQGDLGPVLVKGDQHCSYGQVVGAMVYLQKLGINKVGLVTETPADRG